MGEWVGRRVLRLEGVEWEGKNKTAWGKKLVLEVARRNAKMVAGWQVCVIAPCHLFSERGLIRALRYGFMHGVINTDK